MYPFFFNGVFISDPASGSILASPAQSADSGRQDLCSRVVLLQLDLSDLSIHSGVLLECMEIRIGGRKFYYPATLYYFSFLIIHWMHNPKQLPIHDVEDPRGYIHVDTLVE